jgi:hypothetical protein
VFGNFGIEEGAQVILQPGVRTLLVQAGQAAVASYIGRQDGCEASLYPLGGHGALRSSLGIVYSSAGPRAMYQVAGPAVSQSV